MNTASPWCSPACAISGTNEISLGSSFLKHTGQQDMNILVIGSGGREHALAWKAAQSPDADTVFVAPGNAGTAHEPGVENVNIDVLDIEGLAKFASENNVGLTIVGPEAPLVAGIVDLFEERGLRVFGPSADAAQLEGSKAFTKDFLARQKIPTAGYGNFTDVDEALPTFVNRVHLLWSRLMAWLQVK